MIARAATRRTRREDPREALDSPVQSPRRRAFSRFGMVATAHSGATEAGVAMLERGGNAIDAAVAAAFALGVCEPAASGLGGQTMMLLRIADGGRMTFVDGSSRAPHRTPVGRFASTDLRHGHRATTVPSTPATLAYAVGRYGKLTLAEVLAPAVGLAEAGVQVTELLRGLIKRVRTRLATGGAAPLFLLDGKRVPRVGDILRQPELASTLRRLQKRGVEEFYTGRVGRQIAADMQAHDGLIQRDDLAQIPWPIERRPITAKFAGARVVTIPPPGAGRTLIEMLNILSNFKDGQVDLESASGAVLLAKVIQQAYLDRRDRPFEPNVYSQSDTRVMLDPVHAQKIARRFKRDLRAGRGDTTHLSVMDGEGNAVALTQSIERVFGACVASPELGFLYNNYMSAYEYDDISHPYYLRPAAVPWASVAPTIVMRGQTPWLAIGSPGSERIAPSIVQVLLRLRSQLPVDAVAAPRLHCSIDGVVSLEAARMSDEIPPALERAGFSLDEREPYSFYLGCIQLVLRDRRGFVGVADPRRDGAARGPAK